MSNVSDLTIEVLKDIRAQLGELTEIKTRMDGIRAELTDTRTELKAELRGLTQRVDRLTERVETGFDGVNHRLDSVLKIVGTHHSQLESRVRRIEDHLGLE